MGKKGKKKGKGPESGGGGDDDTGPSSSQAESQQQQQHQRQQQQPQQQQRQPPQQQQQQPHQQQRQQQQPQQPQQQQHQPPQKQQQQPQQQQRQQPQQQQQQPQQQQRQPPQQQQQQPHQQQRQPPQQQQQQPHQQQRQQQQPQQPQQQQRQPPQKQQQQQYQQQEPPQRQQQQQRQQPQKQQQQQQYQQQEPPQRQQQQQRQQPQKQQQQQYQQQEPPQRQQQQQRQQPHKQQQQQYQQQEPPQRQQQQQRQPPQQQQPFQEPQQPWRGKKRDDGRRGEQESDGGRSYQQSQSQQFPQLQPQQQQRQEIGGGDSRPTPWGSSGRGSAPPGFESTVQQQQQQPQQYQQKPAWGQRGPPGLLQEQQMQRPPDSSDTPSAVRQQPIRGPPPSRQVTSPQPMTAGASMAKGDTKPIEDVTKRMSTLMEVSLPKRKNPQRPEKEGRGRLTKLDTNHLALSIKNPNATVYHYDVAVIPEKPFKFYRDALAQMRETYYPQFYPAFDGKKNLYSFRKLPFGEFLEGKVSVWDDRRDKHIEIEVKIKYANSVELRTIGEYLRNGSSTNPPQEALQALDIVLRSPATQRFIQVGRSFFSPPKGRIISLSGGLDLWYGFYQSAIIGWKPFLNVDVAHKGFPAAENCIDLLCDFLRVERGKLNRNMEPDWRGVNDFKAFITTLRVTYEIMKGSVPVKRTYRVIGLSNSPRANSFDCNGNKITVEEYFRQEYRYTIQYPLVPCLECGSKEKPISLPMELCRVIAGQNVNRKLNEEQTRIMVKEAAVSTDLRRSKIEGSIRDVGFNNDPFVRDFGLSVNTQFTEVDARILTPPNLLYKNQSVQVDKGVWRTGSFISSFPLSRWGILCANSYVRRDKLLEFASSLQKQGRQVGMQIEQPTIVEKCERVKDLITQLQEWKKSTYQLAVVVLPDRGQVSYAKVKQVAEQDVGILTQCLKSRTLQKLSPATVTNILLKVNSKHNGINHNITCKIWEKYFIRPVIVFGADVTHPSPGQINVPSVAAVAASYEPKAFSYNMEWRFQPPREEMILDLEEIVVKQLKAFYEYNRGLRPERILFYRDGVSEGQFKKVLETELRAIRRACTKCHNDYKPPITFLVVQKRHHTRFFPTRKEDCDGRNRNVPAGTVVDTQITHINEIDFYLVSHASIQGTSRPTKYHVLWDDANMSEDDIEEITYYLCHLFTRCTRSVSYPAPTYYSHLAAFRIRSYYENQPFVISDLPAEQQKNKIREDLLRSNRMFFV
ncbi:hypothetical protein O3M35_000311 [Rhynocoris fuscipes]|uniref:Argonaute 2 n=1 Tax=Rhynocoris fuscipes TaxID=488301 RepID=A0AAW1DN97_9HEMI